MSRIYNFCLFVASRSHNQNKSTEEHRMSLGAGEDKVAVSDSASVTTHKAHSHSHSVSLRLSLALSHTLYLILLDLCVAYYIWERSRCGWQRVEIETARGSELTRLGSAQAHALEELVALPRELAFPEKALALRNERMNFQAPLTSFQWQIRECARIQLSNTLN